CSSSGYGEASNTRRCTCEPTTACPRPALRSAAIWTSTTVADRMRALTASHPIKPTSPRCPSAWQPNHGRGSTYRRGKSVQTTGTTSIIMLLQSLSYTYTSNFFSDGISHFFVNLNFLQTDTFPGDFTGSLFINPSDPHFIRGVLVVDGTNVVAPEVDAAISGSGGACTLFVDACFG